MNDRIPGTTYDNPIWYRGYRIYISEGYLGQGNFSYCHDSFDGAEDSGDSRYGDANTIEDAKSQIDNKEDQ